MFARNPGIFTSDGTNVLSSAGQMLVSTPGWCHAQVDPLGEVYELETFYKVFTKNTGYLLKLSVNLFEPQSANATDSHSFIYFFSFSNFSTSLKNISGVCTSQVFMQKCSSGWEEDEPNGLTRDEKQICESCYKQRSRQKINKWINGETAGQRASRLGTIEFWVCYNTSRSGNEQNAFKRRTRLSRNSVTAIL